MGAAASTVGRHAAVTAEQHESASVPEPPPEQRKEVISNDEEPSIRAEHHRSTLGVFDRNRVPFDSALFRHFDLEDAVGDRGRRLRTAGVRGEGQGGIQEQ